MTSASGLPSGTVTLLFTDIEGSTRLVKALGDEYAAVRSDHHRLLRAAFSAHEGHEIDTQGDSFFVAFRRGRDAIDSAVAAQRAIAAHDWPHGADIAVRMGIHTGEPRAGEDHYVGIGVHRAARIAAVGHGGQVLLSNATCDLVEDDLPSGVSLRELGRYRLKDIDRPERISQLVVEGLRSDFPPLKAARPPSRLGAFVRRPIAAVGVGALAAAVAVGVFLAHGSSKAHATDLARVTADSVGIVDAKSGRITGEISVGSSPAELTAGIGSIWATNSSSNNVSRIDPATGHVLQTIGVGKGPSGIAVAGGAVWVVNSFAGTVSRIDPATNAVVDTVSVGNQPTSIVAGGGELWVANSGDNGVIRIDPLSGELGRTIAAGSGADGVAYGADSLWVTSSRSGTVSRVDPQTRSVVATVNVGNGPGAVTFGAGALWVANALDGTVSRIDPQTNTVTIGIPIGAGPSSLAFGLGAVWVANESGGTLARIDPATNAVRTYELGNRPTGIALSGGSVFVGVHGAGPAHRGGTVSVEDNWPSSIDPAIAYDPTSWAIVSMTSDGLVAFKRVGGIAGAGLVPDLATAIPQSTGTTYAFTLRRGVRYSTGAAVRAGDVRFAIERLFKLRSPGLNYFKDIVGGSACLKQPRTCDLSRGIATDDAARTVTFHLTRANRDFLYALALPFGAVVPQDTPERDVARKGVPGTGPYRVHPHVRDRVLILSRNPSFREWSQAAQPAGYPDRFEFRGAPAKYTQAEGRRMTRAVEQGRLDWAPSVRIPAGLNHEVRTRFSSQVHDAPTAATYYLALNNRRRPFDNLDARRAMSFALDRRTYVRAVGNDPALSTLTCQVLPPNFPGYRPYCPYTVDPGSGGWTAPNLAQAKRLAAASGTAGATVKMWFPSWGAALGRYVASVVRALGWRPQLLQLPDTTSEMYDSRRDIEISQQTWIADYPAPSAFFVPLFGCASFVRASPNQNTNETGFCDRAVDREVARAEALQLSDPAAARALWASIDRRVTDAAPVVFVGNLAGQYDFVSKRVGNYQYNPEFGALLDQFWVR